MLYVEYIDRRNLVQYADKHSRLSQISKDEQKRILTDISRGPQCIHSQSFIHRDVKPENIIFGQGDRGTVLCNFGLSSEVSTAKASFKIRMGSPQGRAITASTTPRIFISIHIWKVRAATGRSKYKRQSGWPGHWNSTKSHTNYYWGFLPSPAKSSIAESTGHSERTA